MGNASMRILKTCRRQQGWQDIAMMGNYSLISEVMKSIGVLIFSFESGLKV
jgi:hypothetical protein